MPRTTHAGRKLLAAQEALRVIEKAFQDLLVLYPRTASLTIRRDRSGKITMMATNKRPHTRS